MVSEEVHEILDALRARSLNNARVRLLVRYIRRGQPDAGFPLFESESLRWPGFVEFDDVNGKVLTYSAQDRYWAATMRIPLFCCVPSGEIQ